MDSFFINITKPDKNSVYMQVEEGKPNQTEPNRGSCSR